MEEYFLPEEKLAEQFPKLSNFELIGRGGQKQVYKCDYGKKKLALKFIQVENEVMFDDTALDRVHREIKLINNLKSPYLVKVGLVAPGYFKKDNSLFYYYSEEYLDGPTVREMICTQVFDNNLCLKMLINITSAIEALWTGGRESVHRDIKPENIIYKKSDDIFVLIDAGMVLIKQETSLTPTGYVVGTLPYMSPEQISGRRNLLDYRSDLYALGLVAYECITGKHAYITAGMKKSEIINNIINFVPPILKGKVEHYSEELLDVVDILVKKRPHMRFNSCKKLLEKLAIISYN
ncbi:MAG: serine/threonine-protein kinase [bacterium]|nr:serine/threonine-protein kinase [bacterium]